MNDTTGRFDSDASIDPTDDNDAPVTPTPVDWSAGDADSAAKDTLVEGTDAEVEAGAVREAEAEVTGETDAVDEAARMAEIEERERKAHEELLTKLFTAKVYGPGDERIGSVGQVYLDDQTQFPNWVTVKTGLFGAKEFFVPLDEAEIEGKRISVPYSKERVTSAPQTQIDQNLSPEEEDLLYNHYEVPGKMTESAADAVLGELAEDGEGNEAAGAEAADSNEPEAYVTEASEAETQVAEATEASSESADSDSLDDATVAYSWQDALADDAPDATTASTDAQNQAVDAPDEPSEPAPFTVGDLFADDEPSTESDVAAEKTDRGFVSPFSNPDPSTEETQIFRRPDESN